VTTDLFTLNGKNYLTVVDYFPDFVEVTELPGSTSHAVIQALNSNSVDMRSRAQLSRITVHSTAARNFMSSHSAGNLTMSHPRQITRSRMVKRSLQRAFKKAERDGKDPWLALLDYKNTPTEGIGASRLRGLCHAEHELSYLQRQVFSVPKLAHISQRN